MKTAVKVGRLVLTVFVFAAVTVGSVGAVTLTANESVNDGVLNATPDNIIRQSDGFTFWWADKNGDGTPDDPASAGLNLANYNLTRSDTNLPLGIVLNLNDGTADGAIAWSGVSNGDIDTYHNSANASPVIITNAADVTVRDLKTRAANWGQPSGAIEVYHSGNFKARQVYAYGVAGYMRGGPVVLQGGGVSAGTLEVTEKIITSGKGAGSVLITGYSSVTIGSGGIEANKNGSDPAATMTITNIGAGGVSSPLGTFTTKDETGQASVKPTIRISTAGPVTISNVVTRCGNPGSGAWLYNDSGDIIISAGGNISILGSNDTRQVTTAVSYTRNAGDVAITSSGGSVTLGHINTSNVRTSSSGGYRAGNATVVGATGVTIMGTLNLSFGSPAYPNLYGELSLNTTASGDIVVGDDTSDVFDLVMMKLAKFDSASGYSRIGGSVANFDTTSSGGTGTLKDPYITTQTKLRAPSGQKIYYNYVPGGLNDYLQGKVYRLADLAGNAGQGGLLLVTGSDIPKGTAITIR